MNRETQQTISEWAEATFGPVGSNRRVACRANEEMAELLRALSADDNNPKAAEEAADVAIVLYRLRQRMGHPPYERSYPVVGNTISNFSAATGANYAMEKLLRALGQDDTAAGAEYFIRLVFIGLRELGARMGFDLYAEINKKMAVNRAREWRLDGSGHGYHVRAKQPA